MALRFSICAVLLLSWSSAILATSSKTSLPPGFCTVGTRNAIPCRKPGTVCVISQIGNPDLDIPHNGTCHKFAPSLMCHFPPTESYYTVGTTFPVGDSCNSCTCKGTNRKASNATTVCTAVPVADCFVDPCQISTCPTFPAATCQSNYCGGCKADWYLNGHKVDCNTSSAIPCLQGAAMALNCPEGYKCHLNPVTAQNNTGFAGGRLGVCVPDEGAPAPVTAQSVCRQGGNIKPINCPPGEVCQLRGPVPTNPDAARTGTCVPAATPTPAPTVQPVCRQGGNMLPIKCPSGHVCQLQGPVPSNPDVSRLGICVPAKTQNPTPTPTPAGCQCDNSTFPVCGQDGITYQNACKAKCNGASYFPGPCGSCNCPKDWAPVCGSDNHTYINTCDAECHGITGPYKQGECGAQTEVTSCGCSKDLNPVCGSDGKTYNNACLAKCAKISYFPGACGQCICIAVYDPVCSSTGVLYGNTCEAQCHGAYPPFTKPTAGGTCSKTGAQGSTGR